VETMERIINVPQEGRSTQSVAKDVGCSQAAVPKVWSNYKLNEKVVKGKHTGRLRKTFVTEL